MQSRRRRLGSIAASVAVAVLWIGTGGPERTAPTAAHAARDPVELPPVAEPSPGATGAPRADEARPEGRIAPAPGAAAPAEAPPGTSGAEAPAVTDDHVPPSGGVQKAVPGDLPRLPLDEAPPAKLP